MPLKLNQVQPVQEDEQEKAFDHDWDHNYALKQIFQINEEEEATSVYEVNDSPLQQEAVPDSEDNNLNQKVESQTLSSGRIIQPKRLNTYKTYERYYGTNYRWHKSGRPKQLPKHGIPYTYMRCAFQYKTRCPGRALWYDDELEFVYLTKDHLKSCVFNVDSAQQRSALLQKSASNPDNPLKVFKEVIRDNTQWTSSLPYEYLQRTLRRWLRGGCPAVPRHIVDVGEVLSNIVWRERMKYYIKEEEHEVLVESVTDSDDFCHIIFYSPDFISKVFQIDVSAATADGTFRTVPWLKGASQLLIVSVFSFDKITPLFFVVMSSKSFRAYDVVVRKIKELAPSLNMDKLTCDFEIALRNAFLLHFQGIMKVIGCFFHFCYNIDKEINKLGLRPYVNGNYEIILSFTEKLKYLAFLPAEDIIDIFNYLVEQLPTTENIPLIGNNNVCVSVRTLLDPLINYYVRYWLKITTPEVFSVFDEERRTNNDTERNNRSWNEFMGSHPNLVRFIDNLVLFLKDTHLDHIQRCRNAASKRKLSEEEKRKEEIINDGWARIKKSKDCSSRERRIIMLQFLQRCISIKYKFEELNKSLITGEDESVPRSITDTCSVIRNTPWESRIELNEVDWKCPICDKKTGNEKLYFHHIETAHALMHCEQCGVLYNTKVKHEDCLLNIEKSVIPSTSADISVSIGNVTKKKTSIMSAMASTAAAIASPAASKVTEDVMPSPTASKATENLIPSAPLIRRNQPRRTAQGRYNSYPPVEKTKLVKRQLTPGARKAKRKEAEWAAAKRLTTKKVETETAPVPTTSQTSQPTTTMNEVKKINPASNNKPKIISITTFPKTQPALQIKRTENSGQTGANII